MRIVRRKEREQIKTMECLIWLDYPGQLRGWRPGAARDRAEARGRGPGHRQHPAPPRACAVSEEIVSSSGSYILNIMANRLLSACKHVAVATKWSYQWREGVKQWKLYPDYNGSQTLYQLAIMLLPSDLTMHSTSWDNSLEWGWTYLQGLHHCSVWSTPHRARHFFSGLPEESWINIPHGDVSTLINPHGCRVIKTKTYLHFPELFLVFVFFSDDVSNYYAIN